ncbi:MAG: pyruvate ferredoxin oxidoreductase [Prevotellaceae bacterium]|nr:pyruvate ferredoxin oxidoreductase [Prevotellaceae bacterium]
MDYKYINQLLERYWECQTTLEEENILRAFFSQDDIPASLLMYRDLFVYEATEPKQDKLGDDFDAKVLAMIGDDKPVKAKVISLKQRLMPLFKAAAVVAIFLTLGNAMQMSFEADNSYENMAGVEQENVQGTSVAKSDSVKIDSLHRSSLSPQESSAISPL